MPVLVLAAVLLACFVVALGSWRALSRAHGGLRALGLLLPLSWAFLCAAASWMRLEVLTILVALAALLVSLLVAGAFLVLFRARPAAPASLARGLAGCAFVVATTAGLLSAFSYLAVYRGFLHPEEVALADHACTGAVGKPISAPVAELALAGCDNVDEKGERWLRCVAHGGHDCHPQALDCRGILSALPRRYEVHVRTARGKVAACVVEGTAGW